MENHGPHSSQGRPSEPNKPISKVPHRQTTPKPDDNEDMNAYSFPADHAQNPTQCGFSGKAFDKIVGGMSSTPGAWPWIANLGYANQRGYSYLCGGSLISSRHVITAAHCVHDRDDLKIVRLGEYDLKSDKDGAHPINVQIQKKVVHPRYDTQTVENDIAILTLDSDVKFTDEIHPICLPSSNDFRMEDIENTNPFVAGWGSVQFRGPPSSVLKEVQVLVRDTNSCKKSYEGIVSKIDDKVICAGEGGKDSCQGDSGGPLMAPENNIFYLIGIVSNGYKCGEPGYPGVYTRVTSFLDFIKSNTR